MARAHQYRESSLDRRPMYLKPIIEEDLDEERNQQQPASRQNRRLNASHLRIEAWLSPMSDHFPTPKGVHYLAAPILPSSPSSVSADESCPTTFTRNWARASATTEGTEFDDLYDVTDEEDDEPTERRQLSPNKRRSQTGEQDRSLAKKLTPLVIPAQQPGLDESRPAIEPKKTHSSVALASSAKIPMSPAQRDFMGRQQAFAVPAISAPPSLDGSLTSDQLASMSSPPTPINGSEVDEAEEPWSGVRLQPGAMATLNALSGNDEEVEEEEEEEETSLDDQLDQVLQEFQSIAPPPPSQMQQRPLRLVTSVPPHSGLSRVNAMRASQQIIEVPARDEDDNVSEDLPTARPVISVDTCDSADDTVKSPSSSDEDLVPTEIVVDYDPDYARKQQAEALANLDRTEQWLLAQRAYLRGIQNVEDSHALKAVEDLIEKEETEEAKPSSEQSGTATKKVRFSEAVKTVTAALDLPSPIVRQESAYYRAFQDYVLRTQLSDVFVHQLPRFEALQAQRGSLRSAHHKQLLGKHQLSVVPQSAKKRLSANVARGDDTLLDDPEKLRREKEAEAMKQMTLATWHVAAIKFLNGGKLISAPVMSRLARMSRIAPGKDGVMRERARVLDLGGQSTCDWAWHCALQYPNAKVYTVTTKAVRQLSNANIRGPSNHRQVAVERLTKLPFADNQFDLVYARELHSLLKLYGENGEDEWETCVRECMRVLKPGGYIEFSLLDSDIMNAGPLGNKRSVEFGYTLQTLGYDPSPTKMWLGRLARAGFQDVRRAWLCQPLGAKPAPPAPKHDSTISDITIEQAQAQAQAQAEEEEVMGSTDNIANICSIAAGWNWERWLLRCEMEKVAGELRLADTVTAGPAMKEAGECLVGVNAVIEEGRNCRAGFRMLNGYARKPQTSE
ncbi:hypothetical protein ESCO_004342 [Escovopsis weberi]|uniref:Methyltransferase type 11 domain-containing protein n=1 Tax=Escovopsis weberi TaxID=150374 RepID=A0A0M9VVK5_ESCWE|nr:hypothetical protein ESCO_004342 [Escovopsis weberi]